MKKNAIRLLGVYGTTQEGQLVPNVGEGKYAIFVRGQVA